ncbi:thermosensitive gluconokinase [Microdochium trichocladiopsis]|uniref:gluconokinase n=1 Tax=Microdochium trichocladiopsis TaxID=1682393 RepID=A0A9P9BKN8_9PEZI|nr:thermosensitive gluconokinase [Microdochium trichocladiopsis]KAH7021401.1 thermosensitive gluconokinase [Microdochium trichocladiopsis]
MSPPSLLVPTGSAHPVKLDEPVTVPVATTIGPDLGDAIRTVDELVRRRARAHPDRVIVSYPSEGTRYVDYTMQQLDVFAYRVAKAYEQQLPVRQSSAESPMTVAILGPSNFDYLITMLALTKLGHTILFLSTRISQEAVNNLITTTGAVCLLVDPKYMTTAESAQKSIKKLNVLEILGKASFDFPIDVHADTRIDSHLDPSVETNNLIYIIHSSGSTGLPKPICQTQKAAVANYAVSMEMAAFITLPLYHNHGICNLFRAIFAGKPIHLYNASLPLTRDHLTEIMKNHQFEIFYGVPYALKLLSESDLGLSLLRHFKIVMYGGSAMPDELGDLLISRGINLVGHYGATEVGQLMTSFRDNYIRETPKLSPFLKWIPRGQNLFECCVMDGWPAKVASNQDDGNYMTKDLFEPHPAIPKAWKYIARRDDTINLETGEMFNPVSTEGAIRSSKNVTEAVIFGAGLPVPGVLIVPAMSLVGKTDDEIIELVWPVVESACREVEAYARISKSMIKPLPVGCDYPRTDKGSVIRQAFYRTYADEITEVYDRAEISNGNSLKLSLPQLHDVLRTSLDEALAKDGSYTDDTDFFLLGLDSLQATQMRSDILKTVDVQGKRLSQTVVFDHPSIRQLSKYLFSLSNHQEGEQEDVEGEMRDLIEKYSHKPATAAVSASAMSVVLTGATGSLGAHVLAKLVVDENVGKVYCLVRATSNNDAASRVKSSMIQRRAYHELSLLQRRKIVSLASDLSQENLGLSDNMYHEVASTLNSVIHCAWSVNFNMRLSSFEQSNISGVANLISLCERNKKFGRKTGPASFNFCSSVSSVARATVDPVPERLPELEWAQGMGYAQSKSVAEHLCARAAERGVTARVLRVGQIVADTKHGVWNSTEAITMMLQTATTIGALPKLRETPSWLPVDTTAESIVQISLSDAGSVFTHVANPKTFDWTSDLLPALRHAGLDFEEVEPREWVNRLRHSDPDPAKNPPIKLVDFFASKYDKDEFGPSKRYATNIACSLAPALADAPVLDQQLVDKFVSHFRSGAWVTSPETETQSRPRTVVVAAGPCGSGKSTLGSTLARKLQSPFIEGDSLHARGHIEKMASGQALSDQDRASWLARVARRAVEAIDELGFDSVIVSCSALRRSYRDALRKQIGNIAKVVFLDLQCSPELLAQRTSNRPEHYMPASLVESQALLYEQAGMTECDVLPIDAECSPEAVLEEAWWLLKHGRVI